MMKERTAQLSNLVVLAHAAAQKAHDKEKSGALSREDAIKEATRTIGSFVDKDNLAVDGTSGNDTIGCPTATSIDRSGDGTGDVLFAETRSLDATFGGSGVVTKTFGINATAYSAVLQGDGKLVLGGNTFATADQAVLVRYLPSGAFTRAILLGGLDAPTGGQAQRNPQPVLLRLADNAILPNQFRARVKECFIVGAGYGDVSSERAYIRTESLSCVTRDGTAIDVPVKGYVAGEDGKAGVRGRLVTKQGQFIARALMVGFLQGAAEVLNKGDTVTLGLSQTNNQEDGSPWGSAAL